MNIIKLIDYLQQIAAINPNATVYVNDGIPPNDIWPVTDLAAGSDFFCFPEADKGDVYLRCGNEDAVFNINDFKPR